MDFWLTVLLFLLSLVVPMSLKNPPDWVIFAGWAVAALCAIRISTLWLEERGYLSVGHHGLFILFGFATVAAAVGGLWLYKTHTRPIEWHFEQTGDLIPLEWSLATPDSPLQFFVAGFIFSGKNVSSAPIYRPDAFVTIEHNNHVIPLYIVADGQWIEFSQAKEIPPGAIFQIGCQMRGDTLHCAEWTERLSPEQFLRDIGGFKLTFSFDGANSRIWRFTTEQLRRQFEKQKLRAEEDLRKAHPPSVRKRD